MTYRETANLAAQGIDTEDFLQHIAWQNVILPKLEDAKRRLTDRLVASVLTAPRAGDETREQLAGKLQGIDFAIKLIQDIVKEGRKAKEVLAQNNISLQ